MNTHEYTLSPGVVLDCGKRIGAIPDIDAMDMFSVSAKTYIKAINADHNLELPTPKRDTVELWGTYRIESDEPTEHKQRRARNGAMIDMLAGRAFLGFPLFCDDTEAA